jgi:predicted dehydrogenase
MEPVRVGVIGAGIMGGAHAAAIAADPLAVLAGVASLEGADELATRHNAPFATDDWRALLARRDIQVVTVATPDHEHYDVCAAAARAGKHVLVEKPFTIDLAEADRLMEIVRVAGVKAMVNFSHRWMPSYAHAQSAIAAGRIGRPMLAYARKNDTIFVPTKMLRWADRTTPSWFLSCHDIDLVHWFMDAPATEAYATAVNGVLRGRGIATPDAVQAQVRFAHGGVATFEACWIYPDSFPSMTDSFIEMVGTDGVIHLDRKHEQVEIASADRFEWPRTAVMPVIHGVQRGALADAVQHFLACVREDRAPLVTLQSSRHVTAILDAIHRSLDSGRGEAVL